MVTPEQMHQTLMEHTRSIAALQEKTDSAHKRLNQNDNIIHSIHKLAANMENLTGEVKGLTAELKSGLREQGKRIGEVESALIRFANIETQLASAISRIDKIEKEPADKWKDLTKQVITFIVAAGLTLLAAKFLG